MAIADIYNSLTFGGVNSLDYGIYISGPGVFDAPARAVRFVDVPGRNGAIEIDEGHWNNIEVTYKAGTFGDDQPDFASKINAFRNAIVSQVGYQRLTDTYNPDEYRLGIYASGLSVDAVNRNEAGEFDLVFNCKPQRYLLSGEEEISVSSGDTITNPTLYDAGPLLAVEGYGNLNVNGYKIEIENAQVGDVSLEELNAIECPATISFQDYPANTGDTIELEYVRFSTAWRLTTAGKSISRTTITNQGSTVDTANSSHSSKEFILSVKSISFTFTYGVESTETLYVALEIGVSGSAVQTRSFRFEVYYDGRKTITLRKIAPNGISNFSMEYCKASSGAIVLHSSASYLGTPTYIDCELGDAYSLDDGGTTNLNPYIALGSDLPKLNPGENIVTLDNTITSLEITPRWWEL